MKLLHVTRSMSAKGGGTSEAVRLLCAGLHMQGVESEVVSLNAPDDVTIELGCPLHKLGRTRSGYGYSPQLVPWLRDQASRFDAVIVHGIWQYASFGVWRAWRDMRQRHSGSPAKGYPPYFLFPHGMMDPWFKRQYPLKHLKKYVYWLLAEQWVFRRAVAVIFTADEERRLARQSFRWYQCREKVVPLGIEVPSGLGEALIAKFQEQWPFLKGKRVLLYLGRLHPKKGPELAIQAFAAVWWSLPPEERSACVLVMAGPVAGTGVGPAYALSLQDLAVTHFPEPEFAESRPIVFTGMLQGDLKWGALHACEAFLLPSHQENFGIAVVEALACGKPVLISNQINIWREIEQDGAALVGADTLAGTRSCLQRWFQLAEAERSLLGIRARACFEKRFEIGIAAKRFVTILNEGLV